MIALLQRVRQARVEINQKVCAQIGQGLLVFVGFQPDDDESVVEKLLQRILKYRVFEDRQGKMNQSVTDIQGQLLLVPQFTLAADTSRGLRPGFSQAASPELGQKLFEFSVQYVEQFIPQNGSGQFGADMQVFIQNDGPATFWLTA